MSLFSRAESTTTNLVEENYTDARAAAEVGATVATGASNIEQSYFGVDAPVVLDSAFSHYSDLVSSTNELIYGVFGEAVEVVEGAGATVAAVSNSAIDSSNRAAEIATFQPSAENENTLYYVVAAVIILFILKGKR